MLYRGLDIEGDASYDSGEPRGYASGGSPGGWDAEIYTIEVYDWEEFASAFFPHGDISMGTERMLGAYSRRTGKLLPRLEKEIRRHWGEDIRSALVSKAMGYSIRLRYTVSSCRNSLKV